VNEFKLISEPLEFGAKVEKLSPDRRRTQKARERIARGFHPFGLPLRDPRDKTCGECRFAFKNECHSKTYWKCEKRGCTASPTTDLRKSWPACIDFKKQEEQL
jgi:hypothetical protein